MLFRLLRLTAPLLLLAGWTGCAAYKMGSMLPERIQSVYVPTAVNRTGEPLLENETTSAILAALQRDGSLAIETEAEADAVLYVTLTEYDLVPLAFDQDNRSLPNEYRLNLRASVELVEQETGKVLVRDPRVTGNDEFPLAGDLTQGKRVGLPGAAEDLARVVVAAVTEAWPE